MRDKTASDHRGLRTRALVPALCAFGLGAGCGSLAENGGDITTARGAIIGGEFASPGDIPWQALVSVNGGLCGGSLLAPDWVLTAGHCVANGQNPVPAASVSVTLGEHNRTVAEGFEQVRGLAVDPILNPNFGVPFPTTPNNDSALLKLSAPVVYNSRIAPIRPAIGQDGSGLTAVTSGWGTTDPEDPDAGVSSQILKKVSLPVETNATCDAGARLHRGVQPDEMCAGQLYESPGGCGGDSGGPLAVERGPKMWELLGVTSWGAYACPTYTVFGRVSVAVPWIRKHVVDPAQVASRGVLM